MVALPFLAIYKAGAVWLSLRSMLGRARGTSVFDISSFAPSPPPPPPPHKKKEWRLLGSLWLATMRGPTLERLCACQRTEWTCRERTRGGGDKFSSCYTGSSVMSSKMLKLHYGPLWQCGEPTCTWTVAARRLHTPFSLGITACSLLSLGGRQSDDMLQNWP